MTITINSKMLVMIAGVLVLGGGLLYTGVKIGSRQSTKAVSSPSVEAKAGAQAEPTTEAAQKPTSKTATKPTATTAPKATTAPAAGATGVDAQLSALLSSSAWCSFSYNQYTGSSSTSRYTFSSNGTFSTGGRNETYNSGDAGTVAGQYDSSGGGQWKIQNSRLYISSADTGYQFVDVNASLTQNSNGYPIITVGGTEFSQC